VLDAFSSDAIPVHLLTREAFEIYRRHLKPDGVIAVHISNRYLGLQPVVLRLADHFAFRSAIINDADTEWDFEQQENGTYAYASDWVLLSKNEAFLNLPAIKGAASTPGKSSPKIKLWTDEESNLFQVLELDDDGWLAWLRRWAL